MTATSDVLDRMRADLEAAKAAVKALYGADLRRIVPTPKELPR